jgi:AraC-like DNA-binding protein
MNLSEACTKITKKESYISNGQDKSGLRIMCPEYSMDAVDVKTFPLSDKDKLFLICWNVEEDENLYAAMIPSDTPFCYHTVFHSGQKTQCHIHDYIELAYIVEGQFQQRILGKDIKFTKGELCLIDKNCLHQDYLFSSNCIIIFLGLANDIFDELMLKNIKEENIADFLHTALMKQKDIQQFLHFKPKSQEDNRMEELLLSIISELECHDEASKHICKGLLIRILNLISTEYDFQLSNEQRKKMNWLIVEEITRYIKENYADISIKDLVDKFHFNADYYNRLLKEKTGMTYSEYVQDIRLQKSVKYLITTRKTVDHIAELVGYRNIGYFNKIFAAKYGTTPAKYRKQSGSKITQE